MAGYVYLGSTTFGWYKIGKSITPEIRVQNLGILLPFKIKVIAVWQAENHHAMEKALHEMYASNRINGEWFEFTGAELRKLIKSIPAQSCVEQIALDKFSNIAEDQRSSRKVLGLKVQKLRGNFTPEERAERMRASLERQRLKKLEKAGQVQA